MNKEQLRKLLLSNSIEDNKVAFEVIIGLSKSKLPAVLANLFYIMGFDGAYVSVQLPLQFGERSAEILLNHSITNNYEKGR